MYQNRLNEENKIKQIMEDVHKDSVNEEIKRQKIIKEKDKYIDNIYKGEIESEKESQTELNERWHADFAQYCIHCKHSLFREYYVLEKCPQCGRYLHK